MWLGSRHLAADLAPRGQALRLNGRIEHFGQTGKDAFEVRNQSVPECEAIVVPTSTAEKLLHLIGPKFLRPKELAIRQFREASPNSEESLYNLHKSLMPLEAGEQRTLWYALC